ncbi:pilus assembly protein CpaB [Nocardioides humilatus]|uniref:Pilus assembly protein CpaB n=1 Tax=Nocardioides humilatus TaxID=2607660 RepID=A0A5B1LGM7_9ACTN|nr:SAF domain-containing protein [Nocardioides humilatus]KAA1419368.1 pilus assembly protein CpaB [Nocardioides humilatus]
MDQLRDRLTGLRRAVLRRRRPLAALCVAGAAAAALHVAAPPEPPSVEVLVAAHDVPAGAVLADDDLELRDVPSDVAPRGALTEAVGRTLASPLRTGEPLTDVRLVGPALVDAAVGTVATPVRLSDAAQVALLAPGDRVDLLATDPEAGTTEVLVARVGVLAVPPVHADDAGALTGRLVVLGVPTDAVAEVTAAGVTAFVTYAWSNR